MKYSSSVVWGGTEIALNRWEYSNQLYWRKSACFFGKRGHQILCAKDSKDHETVECVKVSIFDGTVCGCVSVHGMGDLHMCYVKIPQTLRPILGF